MTLGAKPLAALVLVAAVSQTSLSGEAPQRPGGDHATLVALFEEWRAFQKPGVVDGVPDYTPTAMAAKAKGLLVLKSRLEAIDPHAWSVPEQVDYYVVRAEMAGFDFDLRVLKPWATNPAFYATIASEESDQPAPEGPHALGTVEAWTYTPPLSPESAARLSAGLRTIPGLLKEARGNLVGTGRDLWVLGTETMKTQSADLAELEGRLAGAPGGLPLDIRRAKEATDEFAAWLVSEAPSKTGPSGVGIQNYDWYLKNVQLVPHTWREEVTIMERELARAHAFLAIEESKNAGLPPQDPVRSEEEFQGRMAAGITEYVAFLRSHDILAVPDYMEAALRARPHHFKPEPREFFAEVDHRDPELMRTHEFHWFDKARMVTEGNPSPIRRTALLYNIFNTRTEGHATGWEELMMQAGMDDARPRTRELVYILLAERAARALGDLRMHSNEATFDQACALASAGTPRGWLRVDSSLVREEQHLYLQQPGYGTSYVVGKIEIERLLGERREQLKNRFAMKAFMEEFQAVGLIPASLVRWEVTGQMTDDIRRMLGLESKGSS